MVIEFAQKHLAGREGLAHKEVLMAGRERLMGYPASFSLLASTYGPHFF